jgi:hypothetical protein
VWKTLPQPAQADVIRALVAMAQSLLSSIKETGHE